MQSVDVSREPRAPASSAKEGVRSIVQRGGNTKVYEALLVQSGSLARVQAMQYQIERLGGKLRVEQAGPAVLVTLALPAPYVPGQFFPAIPFFPV